MFFLRTMIIFFYFSKLITILFEPKHLRFKPFYPTKEMSSISKFYYESSELDDKHGATNRESVCTDSDCTNPDCPLVQYIARTPPEQLRPDSPASPTFECNCGYPRRMDLPCDNPECPDYAGIQNHYRNFER
jgi:hypothetical protein